LTTIGFERLLDVLWKVESTFGIFKKGSLNAFNVYSLVSVFFTKFAGKGNINNIEPIKNIFYKLINHTQRFIGRITPEHFN